MRIPLFPLNMVLLPGIDQHLFVFEDRYRAMILDVVGPHDDVLNPEATFGVACIRNGFEVGAPADTYAIGTIARIRRSLQNPERTFDVAVIGTQRFRILERLDDDPYPRADVELLNEPEGARVADALALARGGIQRYVDTMTRTMGEKSARVPLPADPSAASYKIIAMLELDIPLRQELLEVGDTTERLVRLAELAHREAPLIETIGWPLQRPELRANSLN
ncbi:MAG: hypothetical protein E6G68_00705 [Actinobacteria bacterium]|nr:MAG: hypothetical protein E6G68_00705 [Actinomycetota bacterium]